MLVWLLGLWLLLTGWPGIQPNIPNTTSNGRKKSEGELEHLITLLFATKAWFSSGR
jgi:hypothetical protein